MNDREEAVPDGVVLRGLEGSNPLAFLAALGTLRVLEIGNEDPFEPPRMLWHHFGTTWHPIVRAKDGGELIEDGETLIDRLAHVLRELCDDRPFRWADDTTVEPSVFRGFAKEAAENSSRKDRRCADFAAAFASEVLTAPGGHVQDTALRTMSGAGHQHFIEFMRQLVGVTQEDNLRSALLIPWAYADPGPSLRWDPADDRRYARRRRNPSTEKIRTVRGANRLAIEALPLMATAPRQSGLETTGFLGRIWSWPIWERPADVHVVRSLLAHPALRGGAQGNPDAGELRELGIGEVFRSERITVGKFRCFTPGVPALRATPLTAANS